MTSAGCYANQRQYFVLLILTCIVFGSVWIVGAVCPWFQKRTKSLLFHCSKGWITDESFSCTKAVLIQWRQNCSFLKIQYSLNQARTCNELVELIKIGTNLIYRDLILANKDCTKSIGDHDGVIEYLECQKTNRCVRLPRYFVSALNCYSSDDFIIPNQE